MDRAYVKARLSQVALSCMIPNIGGPRSKVRVLLARVATALFIYAAPEETRKMGIRKKLFKMYRQSVQLAYDIELHTSGYLRRGNRKNLRKRKISDNERRLKMDHGQVDLYQTTRSGVIEDKECRTSNLLIF